MSKILQTIINSNMEALCSGTDCDKPLLNHLVINQIVPGGFRNKLLEEPDMQTRNYEMYNFLRTARTDKDLNSILKALEGSFNTAAFDIFSSMYTPVQGQGQGQTVVDSAAAAAAAKPQPFQGQAQEGQKSVGDAVRATIFQEYPTTGRKKALIMNVLKNRDGAQMDTFVLRETLQRCGFEVVVAQSLTERGILDAVATFKEDLAGAPVSCVLIAVMSHGKSAYEFYSEDDHELHLKKDIVHSLNNAKCPALKNVPKIFLANFCRGDSVDTGTDWGKELPPKKTQTDSKSSVETDSIGSFSDILICHGTYDEHYAYRTQEGTWFIQSFCKTLRAHGNGKHDFIEIMHHVFNEVNELESEEGWKQCAPYENIGFTKKLYLKFD